MSITNNKYLRREKSVDLGMQLRDAGLLKPALQETYVTSRE